MNRRKFLCDATTLSAGLALFVLPVAAKEPTHQASTLTPCPPWVETAEPGIYFASDEHGPYQVVVQEAVLTSGANPACAVGAIRCVNASPFLGHPAGTVQLLSCHATRSTDSPHFVARYAFALAAEGWNRRAGNPSHDGRPLYGSTDYGVLPWGPTPAECSLWWLGKPIPFKAPPC